MCRSVVRITTKTNQVIVNVYGSIPFILSRRRRGSGAAWVDVCRYLAFYKVRLEA